MIVRLDAIGDYVLFRNSLHYLKEEGPYKSYKFTLLGNESFKSIATKFDSKVIDEFIWIKPEVISNGYSLKKLSLSLKLIMKAFDVVINPMHSRLHSSDEFISLVGAKVKIGSKGDLINYGSKDLWEKSNKYYTKLINVPSVDCFEFIRNEKFVQSLNLTPNKPLNLIIAPSLLKKNTKASNIINVLLFPGAGAAFRRWSYLHFAELINILNNSFQTPIRFTIAGSIQDSALAQKITSILSESSNIEDVTGKTDLVGLTELIYNSDILISNETSAVHIAAAVNTSTICISNGNHFGRFNPYPLEVSKNVITIYPDDKINNPEYHILFVEKYKYKSELDINLIKPEIVSEAVIKIINNIKKKGLNGCY